MRMQINIPLVSKPTHFRADSCIIEKVVNIPEESFYDFTADASREREFITEHIKDMFGDIHGEHCILVTCDDIEDGIVVQGNGYNYARYAAFLPRGKELAEMEHVPVVQWQEQSPEPSLSLQEPEM